jgi:ubiquinone/menaquinone biosynthesis C-methylase UbiE
MRSVVSPLDIEKSNQQKYEEDYSLEQVSVKKSLNPNDYFEQLVQIKFGYIKKFGIGKNVLDIGCGNGDYLLKSKHFIASGVGIDFSQKAIVEAETKRQKENATNLNFMIANARRLTFEEQVFDLIYSYASLYHVPLVEEIIQKIVKALKSGGITVLELGNLWSLNTIVCRAYPQWATECHISVKQMKKIISQSGLKILEWRAFQILPLWGEKPLWLKPLLHYRWKKLLQKNIAGKMLDERVSNLPFIKSVSYRHIIVCEKL